MESLNFPTRYFFIAQSVLQNGILMDVQMPECDEGQKLNDSSMDLKLLD